MSDDLNSKREEPGKPRSASTRVWILLGLTGLFFLVAIFSVALIVLKSFQRQEIAIVKPLPSPTAESSPPPVPQTPAVTPDSSRPIVSPTPETASTPLETPSPTPETGSPTPSGTPANTPPSDGASPSPSESATGDSDVQLPSPGPGAGSQATPPPVVANAEEEDATRKEVLKRIDLIPELSAKEKDYLYSQVERARGFTKLAIVPYGSGQLWPDAFQINYLLENLAKPEIAKLFEDPTVVLVLSGYSDLKGSDDRNLEISRGRAENLMKLLHKRSKITNLMRAVGMGGSDLFDKIHLDKNRVVELWIVRP